MTPHCSKWPQNAPDLKLIELHGAMEDCCWHEGVTLSEKMFGRVLWVKEHPHEYSIGCCTIDHRKGVWVRSTR